MRWPWVSREALDMMRNWAKTMETMAMKERAEVTRLTDVIVHMKEAGKVLDPVQTDERWKEGKYLMEEFEGAEEGAEIADGPHDLSEEEIKSASEVEALIDRDMRRAFPTED